VFPLLKCSLSTNPHLSIKTVSSRGNCAIDCSRQSACAFSSGSFITLCARRKHKITFNQWKGIFSKFAVQPEACDWQENSEVKKKRDVTDTRRDTRSHRRIPGRNLQSVRWHQRWPHNDFLRSGPLRGLVRHSTLTRHQRASVPQWEKNPDLLQALLDRGQWKGFC